MHRDALGDTFKEWLGDNFDALLDRYEVLVERAVIAEREACAKIAENFGGAADMAGDVEAWDHIAAAIRARGTP